MPTPVVKYERILRDQVLDDYTENDQPLSRIRRKHENKRNRQFDAFVAYYFDSDNDFVVDKLLPELEETRKFRLCFHSRDFNIGYDIKDNIQEAVESSNSAIILMSQGFVNSNCVEKRFNDCYRENMKDESFSLYVIMMQPADTLVNMSIYMRTLVENRTYLELNDTYLFERLATHLKKARRTTKTKMY